MNRAFHFGFLLAVTAHLTFGCCMHHTHAVGSEIESYAAIQASCPCGHSDHDHDGDPSHHDGDREPCDEEDCVFAVSVSSPGSGILSHAPSVLLVTPLLPITAHERIGNADLTSFRRAASSSLQVLNQAFLL